MSLELHAQRQALEELWEQGLSGHQLLQQHTALVDGCILDHFQASPAVGATRGEIALIALGGYGRRELYPYSDVDLLLLHDRKAKKDMQAVAESILYPLWDAGFDVGHSVRTVKDAIRFAKEDFIFEVSLLDARLLTGSASLYQELLGRYQKKILYGQRQRFVRTMDEMCAERQEKYGTHSYRLEPHIKEGRGGMRDIQAMLWTAKAVFGLPDLDAMQDAGMLSQADRRSFQESWNMLARIRNRLHYVSRRHNDQMHFELQEEMAAAFGYKDRMGMLAVEHFMREVYGHLQTISVVTDLFFEQVQELLGLSEKDKGEQEVERDICIRAKTLRLASTESELAARPGVFMRLFLQAARKGLPVHHSTRRLIARNLHLVDEHFRSSKRVANTFLGLLTGGNNPAPVLEVMLETGLLPAYIREFGAVESLAQHDLYHIYTVDRHQIQTVAELHVLRETEAELFASLSAPHLLYLGALLHDIGKGQRKDHSVLGADLIDEVGQRLGLEEKERDVLAFLVRHHLFLPENALRRDLSDQDFIRDTADLIKESELLTMLYLLSMADSKATGPSAWSAWKASLLSDLFLKVRSCLEAECTTDAHVEQGEEQGATWLLEQVKGLLQDDEPPLRIAAEDLPSDYLISFRPEDVAYHLRLHRDQATALQQKVLLFPEKKQRSWSLLMLCRDRQGLLAKLCGVLALHNLSVLAARIFTWPDGTVVDMLDLAPEAAIAFEEQDWKALEYDLNQAVNYRLDVGRKLYNKLESTIHGRKRQVQQLHHEVVIDNETSARHTVIEVYGADHLGALFQLTQALSDFHLNIHRARVATEVEQLIDIFYVTTEDQKKIENKELLARVENTLLCVVRDGEGDFS
ncbi:MAG: [protein-PII] uridylyltransferase [Candidatus Electrothrix aestuarii]|uniref:Bifunctional uridylyltransferase/uridylyl-removing enzyme n=1 Tax=Candidatus Electrothrix aestuarii TaxID=3062594 RepID=A0AAU8M0F8_9BACT|nr:[protein-PII] uridylyltransferase [Candidatus Electrothrix aestuarii]